MAEDFPDIPEFLQRKPGEVRVQYPPSFPNAAIDAKRVDAERQKAELEIAERERNRTSTRIAKMLERKVNHVGQTWDGRKGKWIDISKR